MYLHIGNGITVRKKNVIGIFDLDSATVSAVTKKYISKNEKEGTYSFWTCSVAERKDYE